MQTSPAMSCFYKNTSIIEYKSRLLKIKNLQQKIQSGTACSLLPQIYYFQYVMLLVSKKMGMNLFESAKCSFIDTSLLVQFPFSSKSYSYFNSRFNFEFS